jgi:cell division protein FtsQ
VVALVLGAGAITRSALLDVDEVRITGNERSDPASLAAATGIAPGTPLLGLDLERAVAGVEAEPWVLEATVDRSWSGTVSVAVVERTPVATINAGAGGWLLVDGQRRVLASSPTPPDLPIVEGIGGGAVGANLDPSAQGALDVARALTPTLRSRVAVIDGADPAAIALVLQPTGRVELGPATELDERMRSLQTVFAQVDLVCLATIDLRVPDAPVLTRVPACA